MALYGLVAVFSRDLVVASLSDVETKCRGLETTAAVSTTGLEAYFSLPSSLQLLLLSQYNSNVSALRDYDENNLNQTEILGKESTLKLYHISEKSSFCDNHKMSLIFLGSF